MRWPAGILAACLALFCLRPAGAQAPPAPTDLPPLPPAPPELARRTSDLTLDNLFTAGWCEDYAERSSPGGAERVVLFRTLAPFQDREVLLNYRFGLHNRPDRVNEHELGPELLLPLNRRLMFDVEAAYAFNGDKDPGSGGASGSINSVLQLVDTACSSLNVHVGLSVPGRDDLREHRLQLEMGVAGFRDLGARFGLQGSFAFDFPLGGSNTFGSDVEVSYSVALTKTLTDDLPGLGHFTPFLELAGTTDLGVDQRQTIVTVLPGAAWALARDWWVAAALEVPLTGPRPFDLGLHVSLIKSF